MTDEYRATITCAYFPVVEGTGDSREAAEAYARLQARKWERDRGAPVEVQVTVSRRGVSPWEQDGDTYEFRSGDC